MRRELVGNPPNSIAINLVPMRISTEMSNAIKRQHGTAGVEYGGTTTTVVAPSPRSTPRLPRKVSLSNIIFPQLDMNGNTTSGNFKKTPKGRSYGTYSKASGLSAVHPQTAAESASLSGVVSKRSIYRKPKDVLVTDFSAFGMGDSRFPQPVTQPSQFYELCHAKVRYIDFLDDVVGYKTDSSVRKGQEFSVGIPMERMHTFAIRRPIVRMNAQMRSASLSSMPIVPVVPLVQTFKQPDHRTFHTPAKSANRQQEHTVTNGDLNSRKPALKPPFGVSGNGKSFKTVAGDLAVRGKVQSVRTENKTKKPTQNDQTLYRRNTRSSSMPFIVTKSSSEPSKKRGVHFSVCNEVFEYVPTAPVGEHH